MIEESPPDGLRPAELNLILRGRVGAREVNATLIDLAARGFLTIAWEPSWAGRRPRSSHRGPSARRPRRSRPGWMLTRAQQGAEGLRDYERTLLDVFFAHRRVVRQSALRDALFDVRRPVRRQLYAESVRSGWFRVNPSRTRSTWSLAGLGILCAGAVLTGRLGTLGSTALVGLAVVLVSIVVLVAAQWAPRRMPHGQQLLRRASAFRGYLQTAVARRRQLADHPETFMRYLGYAVAFGCAGAWADAFSSADLGAEEDDWYPGAPAGMLRFAAALATLGNVFSTGSGGGGGHRSGSGVFDGSSGIDFDSSNWIDFGSSGDSGSSSGGDGGGGSW